MTHPNPGARKHAPPGTERLLAGLTPEQAQAVTHGGGPLLLLAGRAPARRAPSLTGSRTCSRLDGPARVGRVRWNPAWVRPPGQDA